jgi:hypothetical protein
MVSRPYQCPICQSVFRNQSGMKWHIAHKHEIPAAFDALGKDYQAEIAKLTEDNGQIKKRAEQLESELNQTKLDLLREQAAVAEKEVQIMKQSKEMWDLGMAYSMQKYILKERLNIEVPLSFQKQG